PSSTATRSSCCTRAESARWGRTRSCSSCGGSTTAYTNCSTRISSWLRSGRPAVCRAWSSWPTATSAQLLQTPVQCLPREKRTLDPHRELGHPVEGDQVAQGCPGLCIPPHHLLEARDQRLRP